MDEIRLAAERDADAIAAIEAEIFSDPWSESAVAEHLNAPCKTGFVLSRDGRLAGYVLASLVADEGELLRIGTAKVYRRTGVAAALLARFLGEAGKTARAVYLEVRRSNAAARALYEKSGFTLTGVRADYYRDPREDAALYRIDLTK